MNGEKLNKIIEVLIEDIDSKELFKLFINKMTKPAKRQMIGEMLNTVLGNGYMEKGLLFDYSGKTKDEYVLSKSEYEEYKILKRLHNEVKNGNE